MAEIRRIEIEPDGQGGHMVHTHFREKPGKANEPMPYTEPEKKVFGDGQGHDMLAHVANHLGIPEMEEEPKRKLTPEAASGIRAKVNAR